MEKSFLEYYDFYEVACKDRLHLQGQTMQVTVSEIPDIAVLGCPGASVLHCGKSTPPPVVRSSTPALGLFPTPGPIRSLG